tara:strand:- start:396 stop:1418 length:1023 start_codon:yes stop_codon:yes gene_type:complete
MKNIIFLTHAENNPSGGAKVIYRHSQIIDAIKNYSSEVIHIKKKRLSKFKNSIGKKFNFNRNINSGWQSNEITYVKNFKYNWFENRIKIKQNFEFNNKIDFVILPEIFAHLADDLLIKKKIQYAIFVQNGYIIDSTNNEQKLSKAYNNAKFILSISSDTSDCIKLKFPKLKTKILKVSYSLNLGDISFYKKKNIITYMSRKLPNHSNLVISYLKPYLTNKWQLKNLQNLSEKQTYEFLKKSKIFLSFSSLEGLGLPPVEAALAGNHVIGYTGEGGNEYWQEPLFTKINSGEINKFVFNIISKINEKKIKKNYSKKKYDILKKKFSKENEIKNIKRYLKLI